MEIELRPQRKYSPVSTETKKVPFTKISVPIFNAIFSGLLGRFQFWEGILKPEVEHCKLKSINSEIAESNESNGEVKRANFINFIFGKIKPTAEEEKILDTYFVIPGVPNESIPEQIVKKSFREVLFVLWGDSVSIKVNKGSSYPYELAKFLNERDEIIEDRLMQIVDDVVMVDFPPNPSDIKIKGRDYWVRKEGKVVPDALVYKLRNVFRFFTP